MKCPLNDEHEMQHLGWTLFQYYSCPHHGVFEEAADPDKRGSADMPEPGLHWWRPANWQKVRVWRNENGVLKAEVVIDGKRKVRNVGGLRGEWLGPLEEEPEPPPDPNPGPAPEPPPENRVCVMTAQEATDAKHGRRDTTTATKAASGLLF